MKKIIKNHKRFMRIENGMFFKEDFAKLPKGIVIFINKGSLILPIKRKK